MSFMLLFLAFLTTLFAVVLLAVLPATFHGGMTVLVFTALAMVLGTMANVAQGERLEA